MEVTVAALVEAWLAVAVQVVVLTTALMEGVVSVEGLTVASVVGYRCAAHRRACYAVMERMD